MDYQAHYDRLINRAKNRVISGYVEVHHIIPRCIGGGDEKENLVQLTAEEHFVAHQLLHKIYPKVSGLKFAMLQMTGKLNGRNNKLYGWIKRKVAIESSIILTEMRKTPEFIKKQKQGMEKLRQDPEYIARMAEIISKTHKGRIKSTEERANIAEAGRKRERRKFSDEAKKNMAEARRKTWEERRKNGTDKIIAAKTVATRRENGSYEFSEEHRKNISLGRIGRAPWNSGKTGVFSDETRKKMSESAKRRCSKES